MNHHETESHDLKMPAATHARYGHIDAIELAAVPVPVTPPDALRVRVLAAGLNPLDWKLVRGDLRFLRPGRWPKFVGTDFAGVIDEVGAELTGWNRGDPVWGSLTRPLAGDRGTMAEFVIVRPGECVRRPPAMPVAAAAALPIAGVSALQCLRLARVVRGNSVMILGAAGGVGSCLVAMAAQEGAVLTAVCRQEHAGYVRDLAAHTVVARDRTDPLAGADHFDAIIDTSGKYRFAECRPRLKPHGIMVSTVPAPAHYLAMWRGRVLGGPQARALMVKVTPADLTELAERFEPAGLSRVALTSFPLGDVNAAFARSQSGGGRGRVVLNISS
jgi:NADPH:quinone reductase-like Zn-dependent oxidoreductase